MDFDLEIYFKCYDSDNNMGTDFIRFSQSDLEPDNFS